MIEDIEATFQVDGRDHAYRVFRKTTIPRIGERVTFADGMTAMVVSIYWTIPEGEKCAVDILCDTARNVELSSERAPAHASGVEAVGEWRETDGLRPFVCSNDLVGLPGLWGL